jgi:hypothetical protein
MCNGREHLGRRSAATACAFCGGKLELMLCYSFQTTRCSKQCLDRSKAHRDRQWLFHDMPREVFAHRA